MVLRVDGDVLHLVAHHGPIPAGDVSLHRGTVGGRTVIERRVFHIKDLQAEIDEFPEGSALARERGHRTTLSVPLLRENVAIGNIQVRRDEVRPFTEQQIVLLQTFADQAVIAIENVRLFKELQERNAELREALEHQTATAEVLGIISRSPTDVQPVLDAIVESAARVCGIHDVVLRLRERDMMTIRAHFGSIPTGRPEISVDEAQYRWIHEHGALHIPDLNAQNEFPTLGSTGYRTYLAVPLLQKAEFIGVLAARRNEVHPFTPAQIKLLETFADQAVIAIENVRLFKELDERNRQITESLEQQTATSEILGVIASSPTDIQPVLDTVIANAVRLSGATQGHIRQLDGEFLRVVAHYNENPEKIAVLQSNPLPLSSNIPGVQAFLERKVKHVLDARETQGDHQPLAQQTGVRTLLVAPLLREGASIGLINVWRDFVDPFTERQIELVKTFADQAVIAIENVRLFQELQVRNRDLTETLEQQTATSEILRVIARSPTDIQPVLDIIAENAAKLCGADDAVIRRVEGEGLRAAAHFGSIRMATGLGQLEPIERGGFAGRAVQEGRTLHVHDLMAVEAEFPGAKERGIALGVRTALAVPLLRDGAPIGLIHIRRLKVQPFTERQIKLVETFADQAVIAIENVRLFKELQDRNRDLTEALEQQTATSEILRVIARSPTDIQPVLDVVVENAARLCDSTDAAIFRVVGNDHQRVAKYGSMPVPTYPVPIGRGLPGGRAIVDRQTIHIHDLAAEVDTEYPGVKEIQKQIGQRTVLATPLLREGLAIGVIVILRREVRPFSDKQIKLLETFADQAVIAIENVRLFQELEAKTQRVGPVS